MKLPSFLKGSLLKVSRNVFGALALTGLFVGGALTAAADSPAFNNLPNDYATIQVAKPGQALSTSTSASIGDEVDVAVWVHNSVPNTVAHDTKVRVTVPTTTTSPQILTATISADNAATVTGTAAVNVAGASHVTYVSGSAKLMKNIGGTMTIVDWPTTVNPDTLVSTGVNLGDIAGCWQNAQAIIMKVRVEGTTPKITTNKRVELAGGSAGFDLSADAQPGDAVNFEIFLQNTGDATGVNPRIIDQLDPNLTYIPNSSYMIVKRNNQDTKIQLLDSLIKFDGQKITWGFADMAPQPDAALYLIFQARVADASHFVAGTVTHLQNCSSATFDGVSANANCVAINVNRPVDQTVNFTIRKEVTNLTLGNSKWYNRDMLAAAMPGDTVAFRLSVVNTGNTVANNAVIKDILPAGLSFAGNVKLYNSDHPNGMAINDSSLVGNGLVIPTINNGTAGVTVITFSATVTNSCAANLTLKNTAEVLYSNQVKASDYAQVLVSCSRSLVIQKDIKDPADGQFKDSIPFVHEGQILTYRITVTNNGTTWANHPMLWDVLPAQVTYVNNSLAIDGEFMSSDIQSAFLDASRGIELTSLNPGHGKTITFQVMVNQCPPFGNIPLVNTAYVKADGISTISDTASTVIQVTKPIL